MAQFLAIGSAISYAIGGVCNLGGSLVNLVNGVIERSNLKRQQDLARIQAEQERANREHDIAKQNAILEKLKQSSEDALKEQKAETERLLKEITQKANEDLDQQREALLKQQAEIESNLQAEIDNIEHSSSDMKNKLMADLANVKNENRQKLLDMDSKAKEMEKEMRKQKQEVQKILAKKNYEDHYPMPSKLKDHIKNYPNAFRIQVLGARGAGKSTFINKFMKLRVDQFSYSTS